MYIFSESNKIDAVVTQQNDIYESSNKSYITQKTKKCATIRLISIQDEILQFTYYTMIGNGKFEPFTPWHNIKPRHRSTASQ